MTSVVMTGRFMNTVVKFISIQVKQKLITNDANFGESLRGRIEFRCCRSSNSLCVLHPDTPVLASPRPITSRALEKGALSYTERFAFIRVIRDWLFARAAS